MPVDLSSHIQKYGKWRGRGLSLNARGRGRVNNAPQYDQARRGHPRGTYPARGRGSGRSLNRWHSNESPHKRPLSRSQRSQEPPKKKTKNEGSLPDHIPHALTSSWDVPEELTDQPTVGKRNTTAYVIQLVKTLQEALNPESLVCSITGMVFSGREEEYEQHLKELKQNKNPAVKPLPLKIQSYLREIQGYHKHRHVRALAQYAEDFQHQHSVEDGRPKADMEEDLQQGTHTKTPQLTAGTSDNQKEPNSVKAIRKALSACREFLVAMRPINVYVDHFKRLTRWEYEYEQEEAKQRLTDTDTWTRQALVTAGYSLFSMTPEVTQQPTENNKDRTGRIKFCHRDNIRLPPSQWLIVGEKVYVTSNAVQSVDVTIRTMTTVAVIVSKEPYSITLNFKRQRLPAGDDKNSYRIDFFYTHKNMDRTNDVLDRVRYDHESYHRKKFSILFTPNKEHNKIAEKYVGKMGIVTPGTPLSRLIFHNIFHSVASARQYYIKKYNIAEPLTTEEEQEAKQGADWLPPPVQFPSGSEEKLSFSSFDPPPKPTDSTPPSVKEVREAFQCVSPTIRTLFKTIPTTSSTTPQCTNAKTAVTGNKPPTNSTTKATLSNNGTAPVNASNTTETITAKLKKSKKRKAVKLMYRSQQAKPQQHTHPLEAEYKVTTNDHNLNQSQLNVLKSVVNTCPLLTLVQGPPGTGKTTTAVAIICEWRKKYNCPILACAYSNKGVDNLHEALLKKQLNAVRYGIGGSGPDCMKERITARVVQTHKEEYMKQHTGNADMLKKYVPLSGQELFQQVKSKQLSVCKQICSESDVICATCLGAGSSSLKNLSFPLVLFDECTQAHEPSALIPLCMTSQQVVLIGDQAQLPPPVKPPPAIRGGLDISLFDRLLGMGSQYFTLQTQYRMHPLIAKFPSKVFYDSQIVNGVKEEHRKLPKSGFPLPDERVCIINVDGWETNKNMSLFNEKEVECIVWLLKQLRATNPTLKTDEIGIITPYSAQADLIRDTIDVNMNTETEWNDWNRIEVHPVDGFQGREKDFIILSLVRGKAAGDKSFIDDWRRVNVSLTRAKYGLIVVGSLRAITDSAIWRRWTEYYWENQLEWNADGVNEGKPCIYRHNTPQTYLPFERETLNPEVDEGEEAAMEEGEKALNRKRGDWLKGGF